LGDALIFALGAEKLFHVDEGSEYVDTLIAKAIDEYCLLYQKRCATEPKPLLLGSTRR
jgi:26S proteasome regulatory subunit N2